MRTPRAVASFITEYIVVGEILKDHYYEMCESWTMEKFVKEVMKKAGGKMHPNRVQKIYYDLMEEAGLPPLYDKSNCSLDNPEKMCYDCDCWKMTREMCS